MSQQITLFADLATRKLTTPDGSTPSLPNFVLGDQVDVALKLFERDDSGNLVETDLNVRTLRASIGNVLTAPTTGNFSLKIGSAVCADLSIDSTADEVKSAVGSISGGITLAEVLAPTSGCWLLRFDHDGEVALQVGNNTLDPRSFVRIRAYQENLQWWHEVRLIQAPLVFTGSYSRVLPPAPSVRRIRAGSAHVGDDTSTDTNEVQALTVPSAFNGTYYLKFNFRTTKLLGISDGPDDIAAALNGMWSDGETRFQVTNPEKDNAYIEFVGDLGEAPQPLITVSVFSFQPGVISFTLNLSTAELASALRATNSITVPLEVELEVVEDGQDPSDLSIPGELLTLFQQPITIVREQIYSELAEVPSIDWTRPPQPRDYIPVTPDQILFATPGFRQVVGDGVAMEFTLDHPLNTTNGAVFCFENSDGMRAMGNPGEFTYGFPSANAISLTFDQPPPVNGVIVVFMALGVGGYFNAHTHTIAQIIGLQDALDSLGARLAAIEAILPSFTPSLLSDSSNAEMDIPIPTKKEIFFGRFQSGFDPTSTDAKWPRAQGLLPAIHDAEIQNADTILPLPSPVAHAGQVFVNNTPNAIMLPGALGRKSSSVAPGGFFGSDGRCWYQLSHDVWEGSAPNFTNSYFPTDFERELFLLPVNDRMLRPGQTLNISFDLSLGLFQNNSNARWLLAIETGTAPGQTDPAPTGINLQNVVWNPVPMLVQPFTLSDLLVPHKQFGVSISRDNLGNLLANKLIYGQYEGGATPPSDPNFVLRARMIQFDTENNVPNARGFVFYSFENPKASIQ